MFLIAFWEGRIYLAGNFEITWQDCFYRETINAEFSRLENNAVQLF